MVGIISLRQRSGQAPQVKRREFIRFMVFRTVGNFLVLLTVFGFVATFGPALYYEVSYRVAKTRGMTYRLAADVNRSSETELGKLLKKYKEEGQNPSSPSLFAEVLSNTKVQILVPPDSEFSIVVPKIGASEKITANVDPSNKNEYLEALRTSIAHAKGTAYPGINGTTYLFAHSADNFWNVGRYNAVFYLLKELAPSDEIFVFFRGKKYTYEVYDKKIVDAKDAEFIDAGLGAGEKLILQTCWPPGTAWKRLLIFAKPKVL